MRKLKELLILLSEHLDRSKQLTNTFTFSTKFKFRKKVMFGIHITRTKITTNGGLCSLIDNMHCFNIITQSEKFLLNM